MSLNSIQAVGRQAQASVAFLTSIHDFPDRTATWKTKVRSPTAHSQYGFLKGVAALQQHGNVPVMPSDQRATAARFGSSPERYYDTKS